MENPKLISIVHRCFKCEITFSTCQKLRQHLGKYSIRFPHMSGGFRRNSNEKYVFVKTAAGSHNAIEIHSGCPACVMHFKDVKALESHFYTSHQELLLDPTPASPQQQSSSTHQEGARKRRSSSNDVEKSMESELIDASSLSLPSPDSYEHFVVGNFDVTNALYLLQRSILQQKWKLSLEDHVHSAMAINSILLLTPNVFPEELSPFFTKDDLTAIINKIESTYNIKRYNTPLGAFTSIISIVENLNNGAISRRKAISQLLELDLGANESKFVQSIVGLVQKLPSVAIAEDVNESELGTRYIDPFLCGLFDEPDQGMFLRWTNEITLEAKKNENCDTKRPDICITSLHGVQWKANHGFGEVKSSVQADKNNFLLCKDLIRVGNFCKNACATQNMDGVLGLHIVGRTVSFYIVLSPSANLYIMYHLAKIKIPNCMDDLPKLVMDMQHILRVLDVFHRMCIRPANSSLPYQQQMTIAAANHDLVISASQNHKRVCHLKPRHN